MMRADKILCVFFSILVLTAVGVSAEGNAGLEAEMNYRSNTIEITYTSPLAYPAYITAIMTRPEVTAPSVADYLGIGQEMCLENNSVSISLPVGKILLTVPIKFSPMPAAMTQSAAPRRQR